MKILIVNKYLHPFGGAESYVFRLGEYLSSQGHEVQYFGMEHEGRCVSNQAEAYTTTMDFHHKLNTAMMTYPFRVIYSAEASKKMRMVLDAFQPEILHLNNFNYQLTPSILLAALKWKRKTGHPLQIVFTAHDYQLVCPNHLLKNPNTQAICEQCIDGHFGSCIRGRCIHGSLPRSILGAIEGALWKHAKVYESIDHVICPSRFMQSVMKRKPYFKDKTIWIQNFVNPSLYYRAPKENYVLYFGRYSMEKGIQTLVEACTRLKSIPFVFAGEGAMSHLLADVPNIKDVGFLTGTELRELIARARFTVYPSEWYENCPFSIMESQMYGTPVLASDIAGIPELIQDGVNGELFTSKNVDELTRKIWEWWINPEKVKKYQDNLDKIPFETLESYYEKLLPVYLD